MRLDVGFQDVWIAQEGSGGGGVGGGGGGDSGGGTGSGGALSSGWTFPNLPGATNRPARCDRILARPLATTATSPVSPVSPNGSNGRRRTQAPGPFRAHLRAVATGGGAGGGAGGKEGGSAASGAAGVSSRAPQADMSLHLQRVGRFGCGDVQGRYQLKAHGGQQQAGDVTGAGGAGRYPLRRSDHRALVADFDLV